MAKYKIIVIAHSLKNNKIAKFGEVVDESQLLLPPKDLKGFVELVEEVPVEKEIDSEEVENIEVDSQKEEKTEDVEEVPVKKESKKSQPKAK